MASRCRVLSTSEQQAAHPLTKRFFADDAVAADVGGSLRSEVVQFLQGTDAEQLPGLMKQRLRSRWTPVLEQSVECKHAQLHARIKSAPHHSPPYVSLVERGSELTELMRADASALDSFTKICGEIWQPSLVAKALGLAAHPTLVNASRNNPAQPLPHHLVAACVYRADPQTQYGQLVRTAVSGFKPGPSISPFQDDISGALGDDDEPAAPAPAADVSGRDVQGTWNQITNNMTFKNFAATATAKDFFSVPTEASGAPDRAVQFKPLQDITRPAAQNVPNKMLHEVLASGVSETGALAIPAVPDTSFSLSFEQDSGIVPEGTDPSLVVADHHMQGISPEVVMSNAAVAESASPGPDANAQHVFFRLLSSTLSAKKRSRTDRNLALNRNQFCIQRNDVRKIDVAAKQVHVALGGGDTGRSVEMWERPESLRMFLKWTVLSHCHFVKGVTLPQSSQDALGSLLCLEQQFESRAAE